MHDLKCLLINILAGNGGTGTFFRGKTSDTVGVMVRSAVTSLDPTALCGANFFLLFMVIPVMLKTTYIQRGLLSV